MLATAPGVGLAVLTADCVPLLAHAPGRGAVLAVHAGWRGSLEGVAVRRAASAERRLGIAPGECAGGPRPGHRGCCYQVEAEIGERFVDRWGAMPDAWQRAGGHGQLDLRQVNRAILAAIGVAPGAIVDVGPCTSCASADYFSHRASRGRAGRQLSLIGRVAPVAA
ncbi:MAG: polyphenol oxidase family protein [Candidatus Binatia bacterium]